jgi:hypothetical protein
MLLAYRVGPSQWRSDRTFARLLELLAAYPGAADEVSLFDETFPTVAYTPLEDVERTADALRQRLAALHTAGFGSAGINVLFTLGHVDISGRNLPELPFQAMVGHDGTVSNVCACPNSPEFRAYTVERYALMAAAKPDFIWVDDDFRMFSHGPMYPCFCPICLDKFGHDGGRETLVARLNAPQSGDLRRAWSEFCAASLESVCADIHQAVTTVDPDIELGLMTVGYSLSTYGNYPVGRWMVALGARRGRPGHGYYTDHVPRELLNKALDVGRLARHYPQQVETIEYELENYPYVTLDKATRTVLNECTLALMVGCNGIAFNVFSDTLGTVEAQVPLVGAIAAKRPAWAALVEGATDLPLVGLWPADHLQLMANREVDDSGWFWEGGPYDIQRPNQVAEMGVPLTTDPRSACGVLLAGRIAEAFTDDELRDMLSGGVLMDADALQVLWSRGLGELTGVRVGERFSGDVIERLTDHPMNGRYAGDGRKALGDRGQGPCSLVALAEGVGDLAHLIDHDGTDRGCCLSTYVNELGGRVAVSSYAPWQRLGRGAVRHRLLAVTDWLSEGRLPAIIEPMVRVVPLVRVSEDGQRVAVVLLNVALDPTGPLRMRLRACPKHVSLVSADGAVSLPVEAGDNEVVVTVPPIPAWDTATLIGH